MSLIKLEGACKAYGREALGFALHPTNISIGLGEYVAIVGKSGSGKTTLLNLVAGLDDPTRGKVIVEGQDLGRLSENGRAHWRSRSLGIVFQFYQLLPSISVIDNILLAMSLSSRQPKGGRTKRAKELLQMVQIERQAGRLPPTLSGGQQQRAAIARALANDPPLLLLDEPTGSIDSEAAAGVLNVLDSLHQRGRTLLLVTHDDEVASRASRKIILHDGEIISDTASRPS